MSLNLRKFFLHLFCAALLVACVSTDSRAQTGSPTPQHSADPAALPLFSLEDLTYKGAFRLPAETFGSSSLNYAQGPIAYHPLNESLLVVGHAHEQAIAEFEIPPLVDSTDLLELAMADAPLQDFAPVLGRTDNPQNLDRIGGLAVVGEGKLLVNAYEYYDAPGDNTQSMLLVHGASDIAEADVEGFLEVGGAGHTSGWFSPVPTQWQTLLGGTHLMGHSSGVPIISRTSVGPSAFVFNPEAVLGGDTSPVATTTLLDFSLKNPLHPDLNNETGNNELWTRLSHVVYGFIVPGTRSYLTLGHSGGHVSGVCYKCTQDDGHLCGGNCAPDPKDYYTFYWLWDMNDLLAVKEGKKNSFDVRPYAYGEFATPFVGQTPRLGGGAFDPVTGRLYLTVQRADDAQGRYRNPPVVVVYGVPVD